MAEKNPTEDDAPAGAPEWMVTFSDCMTLLLTFFVLLLSFATFDQHVFKNIGASFANALPNVGVSFTERRDSMWKRRQIIKQEKVEKGAEVPTMTNKEKANFMREKRPLDFRNLKVFTAPSKVFFYGDGAAISKAGRKSLEKLAIFLLATPSRIVVSENGPDGDMELGLKRAWRVVEYLSTKGQIDKEMFSITASTTVRSRRADRRVLEITLLERDIYQ